jgi:glucokinase
MILAGDIGGTSTRLGLFEVHAHGVEPIRTQSYHSADFPGLDKIALTFLGDERSQIDAACFGIAGPVRHGHVTGPNLAWEADEGSLARELNITNVKLINDLEANAHGLPALNPEDMVTLQTGAPDAQGNRAVISVGTGLGEAGVYWNGKAHLPFACEGGHADFAPRNELESALLTFLHGKFERVSYERVLSGSGQFLLYEFLRDVKKRPETPVVAGRMQSADPAAVITKAGLAGECPLCREALDWYVSLYGAEAGNLALKMMAIGGVYIGGGVAPKIIQKLQEPIFLNSFLAKGRMRSLLAGMPVRVIIKDTTALLGAARVAAQMAHEWFV